MRRYYFYCIALILMAGASSAMIALRTRVDANPDEIYHLDAFCYFENHWWYPQFKASGFRYSPYGVARVFKPEVVYWLYGRVGSAIKPIANRIVYELAQHIHKPAFYKKDYRTYFPLIASDNYCRTIVQVYRLQNVFLFLVTLSVLFWVGKNNRWAFAIGIILICIPQVIYIFSYANSDAWGLSFSIFLVLFALVEQNPFSSIKKTILLSLLTGAVLLSKENYWLSIAFSYALIGYRVRKSLCKKALKTSQSRYLIRNIAVLSGIVFIIISPVLIIYPLTQHIGPRSGKILLARMDKEKAAPEYDPDSPIAPGLRLMSRGASFNQIWENTYWWELSLKSFYGLFGYMNTPSPDFAYRLALILAIANILLTLIIVMQHWSTLPDLIRLTFILSPLVIILSIALTLYNSWVADFQPQGRYIFPALFAFAFLTWGTIEVESSMVRIFRIISVLILIPLSIFILRFYVV